ncbi:MAG TPA: carbon-nitrogen hydrolase [Vicinamibacteria bacterium]|nr:carbon-nitrogen hydrolase [Vicinamibacteria bacterium]
MTRVALLQLSASEDAARNQRKTEEKIREAASSGASIVCLEELFQSRYFPQRVDVRNYALAEALPSKTSERMAELAAELGIVLIVPLFEEARPGVYFNTALVFDADGRELGKYRKTHIPDGPQYHEKFYFTPGNLGYPVFPTRHGIIGVGICWDQWFPEVARVFALEGAEILFYPSAIGSEPDRPGYSSAEAWRTVIRSHAIANGIFVAAVNRVGVEDEMTFYGESFVADPFGEILVRAGAEEEVLIADLDLGRIRELRELLHFLRDRRIDTYRPLLERIVE